MNPFMTNFKNNYISAGRTGGSGHNNIINNNNILIFKK